MISQQHRKQLKALIDERIAQLHAQLAHHEAPSDQHQQQSDDEAASLDITINSTVASQLTDNTQRELARLHSTLAWLDGEDAGCCEACGCDIPLARLKAVPGSHLCVACAELKGD